MCVYMYATREKAYQLEQIFCCSRVLESLSFVSSQMGINVTLEVEDELWSLDGTVQSLCMASTNYTSLGHASVGMWRSSLLSILLCLELLSLST